MTARILASLLLATILMQGWTQASALSLDAPPPAAHCETGSDSGSPHDCCDGMDTSSSCQLDCGLGSAITADIPLVTSVRGAAPERLLPPGRASPRYLPPNPPPNA